MGPSSSSPPLSCFVLYLCNHLQVFIHFWMVRWVQMGHCPFPEGQLHESTVLSTAQHRAWHTGRKYSLNIAEKKECV